MVATLVKIAFFEVQDWEEPFLKKRFKGYEVKLFKETLDEKKAGKVKDFDVISVFIYSKLSEDLLSKLGNVRLVATRSTGFDHIDLEACRKRGIMVCNVPVYSENTVAEHAFALILSLSRMIHDSYERTRQGDFTCQGVQGFDLKGKILGVLGTGRIGVKMIEIAKGFEMEVLAYDKYPNRKMEEKLGFQYADAGSLLRKSDIVTLHLPLNEETHHFLNKDKIGIMKKGALVINTARGGLVDTEALTEALVNGNLGGAGLDVLEEERLIQEEAQLLLDNVPRERLATMLRAHILLRLKNVIVTPHCAFNSRESLQRLVNTTIENIRAFIGGKPQNIVK
jgi:D-lactate dehydrogenase